MGKRGVRFRVIGTYKVHVLGVHATINQETKELLHDNL